MQVYRTRSRASAGIAGFVAAMLTPCALPAIAAAQAAVSTAPASSSATGDGSLSEEGREFVHQAAKSGHKEVRLARLALDRTADADVRDYAQLIIQDHHNANVRLATLANIHGMDLPVPTVSASMRLDDPETDNETGDTAPGGAAPITGPAGGRVSPGAAPAQRDPGSDVAGTNAREDSHGLDVEARQEIDGVVNRLSGLSGAAFDRAFVRTMIEDHQKAIDLFAEASDNAEGPDLAQFAEETLPKLREHLQRAESLQEKLTD